MRSTGRTLLGILTALAVLGSALMFAQPNRQYRQMYDVATPELLRSGEAWLNRDRGADSALVCFSLAASRYNKNMSRADQELMVKANIGKWLVYFSYLFDYPKAYESLQTAIEISDRAGIDKARTRLSMGGMFHLIADQSGAPDLYRKAVAEYATAIREALKENDDNTVDIAFVNTLIVCRSLGETATLDSLYGKYGSLPGDSKLPRRRFAKALYRATAGNPAALDSLDREISLLPDDKEYVRLRFIGIKTLAELYLEQNNPVRAESEANRALEYSLTHGLRDAELETRLLLSDILNRRGDMKGSLDQRDQYLRIKEEMLGSKQLQRLDELRFLADLRAADEKLALIKEQRRQQTIVIVALLTLFVMAVTFILIIIHKNHRLRQAYDSLSQRFQAILAADDRERKLLKRIADIEENHPVTDTAETSPQTKYEGSSLGDKQRERILSRLADITADPDIICSPGCSISKLSEVIGCNTKYLSQIINDEYNCNFNSFINEIRIKEASRRIMAGGEWDKLTMEAIANSVGFKSRSTFSQLFKQYTGMTPAEFRRHAGS